MKEVWHAIVQCYVKGPLLYLFTTFAKKKRAMSIKLKCNDELFSVVSLWPPTPLCLSFTQYKSEGLKKRFASQDVGPILAES